MSDVTRLHHPRCFCSLNYLCVRRYVARIGGDPLIHREIASAINGLVDFLKVERRRVPDAVIYEASRLESLLFSGYDPHFEGDEPAGL